MQPAKQDASEPTGKLPDDANMGEIMYWLYALDKIRKGQEAVKQGKATPADQVLRDILSW